MYTCTYKQTHTHTFNKKQYKFYIDHPSQMFLFFMPRSVKVRTYSASSLQFWFLQWTHHPGAQKSVKKTVKPVLAPSPLPITNCQHLISGYQRNPHCCTDHQAHALLLKPHCSPGLCGQLQSWVAMCRLSFPWLPGCSLSSMLRFHPGSYFSSSSAQTLSYQKPLDRDYVLSSRKAAPPNLLPLWLSLGQVLASSCSLSAGSMNSVCIFRSHN